MNLKQIYRGLNNPRKIFLQILILTSKLWSDELYIRFRFYLQMEYKLNLKPPRTFTEKLQWLKIHNHKPEYTTMVDKYAVKDYVASKIGAEYIIPTIGVWDKPEDIDWDSLPNQFVLKTTHGGGSSGVIICKDKNNVNRKLICNKLNKSLKLCLYELQREWPYKNVPKRIIAEKYMTDGKSKDLSDYKFFCFDGEPLYCQVIRDRHTKETIDFYDMQWNHMPFVGLNPVASNGQTPVAKPIHLDKMMEICRKLAKDIPFVRIDLYVINDKEYFGEITFYPNSGIGLFTPSIWNLKLGSLININ